MTQNGLLNALPSHVLQSMLPWLHRVSFSSGQSLTLPNEAVDSIWFLETGYVSRIVALPDGSETEVGAVGREGLVGHSLILGGGVSSTEARALTAGTAMRLDGEDFRRLMNEESAFHDLMLEHVESILAQTARMMACNGHHGLEQRLARWLLAAQDRLDASCVPVTQEDLASRLCVWRTSVTTACQALHKAGAIRYSRGRIEISDRAALEDCACECHSRLRIPDAGSASVRAAGVSDRDRLSASQAQQSGSYRVHFLGAGRRVMAIDIFDAIDDDDALTSSASIIDASRDRFATFELWRGVKLIATERDAVFSHPPGLTEMAQRRQIQICEREEILRDSFACIRGSRKLLRTLASLQANVGSSETRLLDGAGPRSLDSRDGTSH